ncbi:PhzF family phenazine biosynthesis protein [Leptotrichia wadei]|jgi:type I restriction-modification system DNA-methyltransferase|uniref:PhzF family phenazine biosynthesis protein n=1 Tax=Leptotrichia wadei TaxID=157687 RepID=UPI00352FE43B
MNRYKEKEVANTKESNETVQRAELHRKIWAIADNVRGAVDGWDFKQYILGILFYRFISENMTEFFNKAEHEAGDLKFNYADISDEEAKEDFRAGTVEDKGFFILPSQLFENVVKTARTCVLENSELVEKFEPNLEKIKLLDGLLLHITAKADENSEFDCISRSFAPKLDVAEDPVCGSGHCHLVPLWSDKLGKNEIVAFQASKRTGILYCKLDKEKNRVSLSGKAVLFAVSEIFI